MLLRREEARGWLAWVCTLSFKDRTKHAHGLRDMNKLQKMLVLLQVSETHSSHPET
jgi:hypothetical protein